MKIRKTKVLRRARKNHATQQHCRKTFALLFKNRKLKLLFDKRRKPMIQGKGYLMKAYSGRSWTGLFESGSENAEQGVGRYCPWNREGKADQYKDNLR